MLTPDESLGTIEDVASVSYTSPVGHHLEFGFFDAAKQKSLLGARPPQYSEAVISLPVPLLFTSQ